MPRKDPQLTWIPPANPRDAYGHCVPDRLCDVFLTRAHLVHLAWLLQAWRGELTAILPERGCQDIDRQELLGLIETLWVRLNHAMPLSACDCDPVLGDQCTNCRGEGWVSMKSLLGRRRSLKVDWSELQSQSGATPSDSPSSNSNSPDCQLPPLERSPNTLAGSHLRLCSA